MSYHDLSSCTLNADERRAEADRIVEIIRKNFPDPEDFMVNLSASEYNFVLDVLMERRKPISVKQLFWLRDIKDKCL